MSLGFSVNDFLATIELANKIRKKFVDAPSQFRDISNEVKNLSNVLRDIEDFLPERTLSSQQITDLRGITGECRNVLKTLKETLDKYQELKTSPTDISKKVRRGWKRLTWEPGDITKLRRRITSNIVLLSSFQGKLVSQISLSTKEGVDQLRERQDNRERREESEKILQWITPIDYDAQQSDFISRRQEGTGRWLLESDQFRTWVDQSSQTLFCPGIPGAGKTMSAAIVVDELYSKFQNDVGVGVGVSYVYCNFRRQQEQRPVDLLASLLKQLVQELPSMPEDIKRLYKQHRRGRTYPPFDKISQVLQSVVRGYSKLFIIVDALDECQVSDAARQKFLEELFDLQAMTSANLFITSRFVPGIERDLAGRSIMLEIRASDEDLERYLDGNMPKLPSFVSRSADLQKQIKAAIVKAVDGMFLLAQLHLDSLVGKRSPKALRNTLETLPKGSEAYDQAYREAMERIEDQVPGSVTLAKQVLSWITCAKRPLTTLELQHALAVEVGKPELNDQNLTEIDDMVSVCAGLVTVDEKNNIIRLVHYTTQNFFERTQQDWFPNAEAYIIDVCVTYLSFDIFDSGPCLLSNEFQARLQHNPLYNYAAVNWGHHLRNSEYKRSIVGFLKVEAKVSASAQNLRICRGYSRDPKPHGQIRIKGIHLAALFGLTHEVAMLLEDGEESDCKVSNGQTPLSHAAENGHEAVVRLLLARDDIDINSRDYLKQTPLSYAALEGHEAVIRLLLARDDIDINSRDYLKQTPLSYAALEGHEAVIRLLLARDDIDINSRNHLNNTPLHYAAREGDEAVIRLLLARDDIDINSRNVLNATPLHYAVKNRNKTVIQLLLARNDIDINLRDYLGLTRLTPLSYAEGHKTVIQLLLARDDIDINSRNHFKKIPLPYKRDDIDQIDFKRSIPKVNATRLRHGDRNFDEVHLIKSAGGIRL